MPKWHSSIDTLDEDIKHYPKVRDKEEDMIRHVQYDLCIKMGSGALTSGGFHWDSLSIIIFGWHTSQH